MINEFEVGDEVQFKGSTEEWIDAEIIYKGVENGNTIYKVSTAFGIPRMVFVNGRGLKKVE